MDFLGVVMDVLDELQATSRSFTEDEEHVVGEILWEAAQCLRYVDPSNSKDYMHIFLVKESQALAPIELNVYSYHQ